MPFLKLLTVLIIYLAIPVAGFIAYTRLARKMQREGVQKPPSLALLAIFATYGGLLLVILTSLFWMWSGLASLGMFYLILGAPVVMAVIAWRLYEMRSLSIYHRATFKAAVWYYAIAPACLILLFLFVTAMENR